MPRYEVLKDYRSGGHGPWEKGSKIELDEADAAWVERDSTGTLKEIPPLGAATAKAEAETARAEETGEGEGAMSTEDQGVTTRTTATRSTRNTTGRRRSG